MADSTESTHTSSLDIVFSPHLFFPFHSTSMSSSRQSISASLRSPCYHYSNTQHFPFRTTLRLCNSISFFSISSKNLKTDSERIQQRYSVKNGRNRNISSIPAACFYFSSIRSKAILTLYFLYDIGLTHDQNSS